MQKLVTGMTVNRGFTLIEILIVIVIIGITIGFALIAFGDFGDSKRILFSAEQLRNTLRLAQQQAILESSTMGLRIDSSSYQMMKLSEASNWSSASNKGIYKINYFPKKTIITIKTSNNPAKGTPTIVINASGDMTPFIITMGTKENNTLATLRGHYNGDLTLEAGLIK